MTDTRAFVATFGQRLAGRGTDGHCGSLGAPVYVEAVPGRATGPEMMRISRGSGARQEGRPHRNGV